MNRLPLFFLTKEAPGTDLAAHFAQAGREIVQATSLAEAMVDVERHQYLLYWLDGRLVGRDLVNLVAKIRRAAHPVSPVFMLQDCADLDAQAAAYQAGVDGLLSVPWSLPGLTGLLDQQVARLTTVRQDCLCEVRDHYQQKTALLQKERDLLLRARQVRMGDVFNLVAHQWRQPLTVINSITSNLELKQSLGTLEPTFLQAKLNRISQTVNELSDTIETFRSFFSPVHALSSEDLVQLFRRTVDFYQSTLTKKKMTVEYDLGEDLPPVRLLVSEIVQVFLELLHQAVQDLGLSTLEDRRVRVDFRTAEGFAVLRLRYYSQLGAEVEVEKLFDPYVSPDQAPSAGGMGLYLARVIVEDHHSGRLVARREAAEVVFELFLPMGRD